MTSIDVDGFDDVARGAVDRAVAAADELGAERVGTEHLLLGILDGDDTTSSALVAVGATPAAARHKVGEASGGRRAAAATGALEPTSRASRSIARARWYSHREKADAVGTRHLLLGVLDVEGTAGQVLRGVGADLGALRKRLTEGELVAGAPASPSAGADVVQPTCGHCGAAADELSFRRVPARDAEGRAGEVVVFACRACGAVLGVARARES